MYIECSECIASSNARALGRSGIICIMAFEGARLLTMGGIETRRLLVLCCVSRRAAAVGRRYA